MSPQLDACPTPTRARLRVVPPHGRCPGEAALPRSGRCKEATWIVELEDLPAGAVAVLLLLAAVLLVLST